MEGHQGMTLFEKAKTRMKVWLAETPEPLQPLVRALLAVLSAVGVVKLEKYVYAKLGFPRAVLNGPLAGMAYLPISFGSALLPKITGTYEKELHPHLEKLKGECFDVLVDVGSAEGYYAIGLTRLLRPQATHCYDTNTDAHGALLKLAEINGVTTPLKMNGLCTPANLEALLAGAKHPLVFMDCEGGEFSLLDPARVPALARATLFVETHYARVSGRHEPLEKRFETTHQVEKVVMLPRSPEDAPAGGKFSERERMLMVDERRRDLEHWLVMTPRRHP